MRCSPCRYTVRASLWRQRCGVVVGRFQLADRIGHISVVRRWRDRVVLEGVEMGLHTAVAVGRTHRLTVGHPLDLGGVALVLPWSRATPLCVLAPTLGPLPCAWSTTAAARALIPAAIVAAAPPAGEPGDATGTTPGCGPAAFSAVIAAVDAPCNSAAADPAQSTGPPFRLPGPCASPRATLQADRPTPRRSSADPDSCGVSAISACQIRDFGIGGAVQTPQQQQLDHRDKSW